MGDRWEFTLLRRATEKKNSLKNKIDPENILLITHHRNGKGK